MASNLKTLIITGASNGLGLETVKKIAKISESLWPVEI